MGQSIDSVSCGDQYTAAATLQDIYAAGLHGPHSNGGNFTVVGNDAFVQLQWYTAQGQFAWTPEFHAPVGPSTLSPGTTGVRFRNYTAGSVAVVSAGLFYPAQPVFTIAGAGTVAVASGSTLTGIIPATGTTPTGGTGFTYTHTNGTGIYVFTFTTPFAAPPTVVVSIIQGAGATRLCYPTGVATANGVTITTQTAAGVGVDNAFQFIVMATV